MTPSTVIGRLLIALGVSLIIGSLVGSLLATGNTLEISTLNQPVSLPPNYSLVLAFYSVSSNGTAHVLVKNATNVFYVADLVGDPRSLLRALTTFNINLTQSSFKHDFRLGVVYGTAIVKANSKVLGALPSISTMLKFNIKQAEPEKNGDYIMNLNIKPGEAFLIFIIGGNKPVSYNLYYTAAGAERLPSSTASIIGLVMTIAGAILYQSLKPVTLLGERIVSELRKEIVRKRRSQD